MEKTRQAAKNNEAIFGNSHDLIFVNWRAASIVATPEIKFARLPVVSGSSSMKFTCFQQESEKNVCLCIVRAEVTSAPPGISFNRLIIMPFSEI